MWECCGKTHLPSDRLATFHLFSKAPAYPTCELIPFKVRDRNPKAPSARRAALLPRMLEVQPFSWPNPPPHDTLLLLVFIFTSTKSILLLRRSSKSSSHFVTHLLSSLTLKQRVIGGFSWEAGDEQMYHLRDTDATKLVFLEQDLSPKQRGSSWGWVAPCSWRVLPTAAAGNVKKIIFSVPKTPCSQFRVCQNWTPLQLWPELRWRRRNEVRVRRDSETRH